MKPEWSYDIIAPIYDFDMGRNMPFDDLAGYLALLPPAPAQLLEVGCGTGRLTLPLADRGYSITAIDRSGPMLEQLHLKQTAQHDTTPLLMDARHMSLAGPFDAVIFAYSGFQYLLDDADIKLFCEQVQRLITTDGSLILDIFLHREGGETSTYILDYERELDDGCVLSRHKRLSIDNGVNTIQRKYKLKSPAGQQTYQTESRQRLYSPASLVARLEAHGFKLDTGMFDYLPHHCDANCCHRFFTARFISGSK
jgi:ubiquinone/menaquinone biosynthesis C-methylase UbiE